MNSFKHYAYGSNVEWLYIFEKADDLLHDDIKLDDSTVNQIMEELNGIGE